ncbi:MAG: hypothetical protein AB7R89_03765 [Dehalococcoidia bacterium]
MCNIPKELGGGNLLITHTNHGGGTPKGNRNPFKHGRYSRFRDALPPQPVAAGAARRLITREQRIAERHAANLLALARLARYRADCVAAVESGTPLPPPPLITERDIDLPAVTRLLGDIAVHVTRERGRAAGLITPETESVAKDRAYARNIERILPFVFDALDRSAAASLSPTTFTALLDGTSTKNNPEINPSTTPSPKPAAPKQPTNPDSPRASRKNSTTTNHCGASDHQRTTQPDSPLPQPEGVAPQ